MNTIELVFAIQGDDREIMLAYLSDAGFEAFEETEKELRAYISEHLFKVDKISRLAEKLNYPFQKNVISPRNWNEVWEAGFEPVSVPGFCTVRASFHTCATETGSNPASH